MAVLKCKMCGDNIEVSTDKTYGTCESCGSTMTLPKIDDDQKVNLYNRANHIRRQNEFDKALAIYEKIIHQDDSEAEAHWGAVLCRFGIEYVEDPTSQQRVPTCHRASFSNILDDVDYLAALKYSTDVIAKGLYEKEAAYIAGVQRDILAISQKEKPYDVFICYKETDASGNRTQDSAMAQDVYYQLINEGFKVFFARISLEDKLGTAYEPYIFAALNSAKVMVIIGTQPEYYNAVWVKNEWSRYLNLLKTNKSRLLIPCYRGMDPYDLPEELSMLQSQDMGKIGFVQDLIRGVKKVLVKEETPVVKVVETVRVEGGASANVDALLKRINLFLEDGEWDSVMSYCDKVLDMDAECAMAYAYIVCAKLRCRAISKIPNQNTKFLHDKDWQKALRFGTPELKAQLEGYEKAIADRLEENRKAGIYNAAIAAKEKKNYQDAINGFSSLPGYKDAEAQIKICQELKEENRKAIIYQTALTAKSKKDYKAAIKDFSSISDYRDATNQIAVCEEAIKEETYANAMKAKNGTGYEKAIALLQTIIDYKDAKNQIEECQRLAAELQQENAAKKQQQEKERLEKEKQEQIVAAKRKKLHILLGALGSVAVICIVLYMTVITSMINYNNATALMEQGSYDEASLAFSELGNYKDSAVLMNESLYIKATKTFASNDYDGAAAIFVNLGDYKDSADMVNEVMYTKATEAFEAGDTDGAAITFVNLGDYKDSASLSEALVPIWREEQAQSIAAGDTHTVGLKSDGTVIATVYTENTNQYDGQSDVSEWTDIVSISAGEEHTVGLKSDGLVVATGNNGYKQCKVSDWTDIVAISAGDKHTVGLKSDGTVVAVGMNSGCQCNVSDWTDIVAISAGDKHTVGLKSDGTVIATEYLGNNPETYGTSQRNVSEWTDIVAISAGNSHTVGIKSDGTVVAVGSNSKNQLNVSDWTDIVAVATTYSATVGLKSDGTIVLTSGSISIGLTNIVDISSFGFNTVYLKSDGTVRFEGGTYAGVDDVSDWENIMVYNN